MKITVLLFAAVAERVGQRRLEIPFEPGDTVARVCDRLVGCYPMLAQFVPTLLFAVNEEYVKPDAALASGDVMALIPPVSGG